MKDKIQFEAVPDTDEVPVLGKNMQLFNTEISSWFRERRSFLESRGETAKYAELFREIETNLWKDFGIWATRDALLPEEAEQNKNHRETWEWELQRAHKIFHRALKHLEKIGYGKKKRTLAARVKYNKKRESLSYYNPDSKTWQEKMIRRNSNLAYLCQEIYQVCRQKNGSCSPKALHDFLRIHAPKCRSWTVYDSNRIVCWNQVSGTVRSVNRWAKKQSFPMLLKCSVEQVTRLL